MHTKKENKKIVGELTMLDIRTGSAASSARAVGVSASAYSQWKSNKTKISIKHLNNLKNLGCKIEILRPDLKDFLS